MGELPNLQGNRESASHLHQRRLDLSPLLRGLSLRTGHCVVPALAANAASVLFRRFFWLLLRLNRRRRLPRVGDQKLTRTVQERPNRPIETGSLLSQFVLSGLVITLPGTETFAVNASLGIRQSKNQTVGYLFRHK